MAETLLMFQSRIHLTYRERQVLRAVTAGLTNREIASVLSISEHSVKNHVSALLGKLQVRNRVELTLRAMREAPALGLLDL